MCSDSTKPYAVSRISMCAPRVLAHARWALRAFMCYFCVFSLRVCVFLCVCLHPGEVDDVLDSVCVVHNS